jgi:hypothetical protein
MNLLDQSIIKKIITTKVYVFRVKIDKDPGCWVIDTIKTLPRRCDTFVILLRALVEHPLESYEPLSKVSVM